MPRLLSARAYAKLPTEQANPRTRDIDRKDALGIARLITAEDRRVPEAVARVAPAIARGIDALAKTLASGGSVLALGAGTSGRLAVLEAAECPPTFNTAPGQIRGVIAGGNASMFRAKEGAEDSPALGRAAVSAVRRGDSVIGVAASGVTPFVRAALEAAKKKGATTILVTSNGNHVGCRPDIAIVPLVGPEVVTGSTRLKAGTAAKLALNALTTGAMIRVGKVYDHWMVDLRPTNRKLRLRAGRIISDLGGVPARRAEALLRSSGGSVKTAVVMAKLGVGADVARRLLKAQGGKLRPILEG